MSQNFSNIEAPFKALVWGVIFLIVGSAIVAFMAETFDPMTAGFLDLGLWITPAIFSGALSLVFLYRLLRNAELLGADLPIPPWLAPVLNVIPIVGLFANFYTWGLAYKTSKDPKNWRSVSGWPIYIFLLLSIISFQIAKYAQTQSLSEALRESLMREISGGAGDFQRESVQNLILTFQIANIGLGAIIAYIAYRYLRSMKLAQTEGIRVAAQAG